MAKRKAKPKRPKLYEITGMVSYSVVIAAASEADAMEAVEGWEKSWAAKADLVGVSDVELFDVRKCKSADVDGVMDEAHLITVAAEKLLLSNGN